MIYGLAKSKSVLLSNISDALIKPIKKINVIECLSNNLVLGEALNMLGPLSKKILEGLPVWGTCTGIILLAKELENDTNTYLPVMDIKVRRNAYGSQINSFKTTEVVKNISSEPLPLVFIRAPYITSVGEKVKVLHEINNNNNIVAARQDNMLVTSFHPELTSNLELNILYQCGSMSSRVDRGISPIASLGNVRDTLMSYGSYYPVDGKISSFLTFFLYSS